MSNQSASLNEIFESLKDYKCVECGRFTEEFYGSPPCFHLFCKSCSDNCTPSKPCPQCGTPIDIELFTPDKTFTFLLKLSAIWEHQLPYEECEAEFGLADNISLGSNQQEDFECTENADDLVGGIHNSPRKTRRRRNKSKTKSCKPSNEVVDEIENIQIGRKMANDVDKAINTNREPLFVKKPIKKKHISKKSSNNMKKKVSRNRKALGTLDSNNLAQMVEMPRRRSTRKIQVKEPPKSEFVSGNDLNLIDMDGNCPSSDEKLQDNLPDEKLQEDLPEEKGNFETNELNLDLAQSGDEVTECVEPLAKTRSQTERIKNWLAGKKTGESRMKDHQSLIPKRTKVDKKNKNGADVKKNGKPTLLDPIEVFEKVLHFEPGYSIQTLYKYQVNPNSVDSVGWTWMHKAVKEENKDFLEYLLAKGGSVNAYREDQYTCLHDAVKQASPPNELSETKLDIIRTLLTYEADIEARDLHGITPYELAENVTEIKQLFDVYKITELGHLVSKSKKPLIIDNRKPVIYGHHLPTEIMPKFTKFALKYKFKLHSSEEPFNSTITHVVVNNSVCAPEREILMSILNGCYVLSVNWIIRSLKSSKLRNVEKFEINGTKNYGKSNVFHRSRENSVCLKPRLFKGGSFYLMDSPELSEEEKQFYSEMIILGGGTLLSQEPKPESPFLNDSVFIHADQNGPLSKCSVIILYKTEPAILYSDDNIKSFPLLWLYEAIQTFSITEPSEELIKQLNK